MSFWTYEKQGEGMKLLLGRLCVVALLALCSLKAITALPDNAPKELAGNWVYRLGSNALFVLHLESDPADASRWHGYFLHPGNFNLSVSNGAALQFSKITNQSQRDALVSVGWQSGELRLVNPPSGKGEGGTVFSVRLVDSAHVDFSLVPTLPPLRMERTSDEPRLAGNWDSARTYTQDDFMPDSTQMAEIVAADQADRKDDGHWDAQKVERADAERRAATASLLREGKLHTGHDFESAALVFQHGATSDDYLLAHVLAMVAVSKGQRSAAWISAATLDRYLQSMHQPQIFGTQFATRDKEPATQEPYNRGLISDLLRREMTVPDLAAQDAQRRQYDLQRGVGGSAPSAR